jgi:hypothetical protein
MDPTGALAYREKTPGDHAPAVVEEETAMTMTLQESTIEEGRATGRAEALAARLEAGAAALATFANTLSEVEWQSRLPGDGRRLGVVVHHVASVYPVEIHLAQTVAGGQPVHGVTAGDIDQMNATHAREHDAVTKDEAVALLLKNSAAAAAAIRALTDAQLAQAAAVSLYAGAPLTCQFVLEDHAVRHSYHHLARIRAAVGR